MLGNMTTFYIMYFLSYCTDFKTLSTCKIPHGSIVHEQIWPNLRLSY